MGGPERPAMYQSSPLSKKTAVRKSFCRRFTCPRCENFVLLLVCTKFVFHFVIAVSTPSCLGLGNARVLYQHVLYCVLLA